MFTLLGLLLAVFGLATGGNAEMYSRSLDININLWTGVVMFIIGILMLATSKLRPVKEKVEEELRQD
jgi:hypothetical protein